eukprot:CAMPEP_0178418558 /NCGR_PEP_ID=MMETSP0689_2-20121128/25151_1 /TAXON_ID=160604 /ORGANISM="Amphidinium massartii, Strain CS-259" /LENGTH=198 /DNA_ID=CAMNT_0020039957 /DNA_START=38 /DNA_END=635 /DNA_ORIENTATION=+
MYTATAPQEEYRPPWALAQAEKFESDDCPFCALRKSNASWLRTEIKRLSSEVAYIDATIPPRLHPDLQVRLEGSPLPASYYTGGVEDIHGQACPSCVEERRSVEQLQLEARGLDAQCKARIDFHRKYAPKIEALLIEKRRVEAEIYFRQHGVDTAGELIDGHFNAITKVNQPDEDATLEVLAAPVESRIPPQTRAEEE